jgi:hypothetical protein
VPTILIWLAGRRHCRGLDADPGLLRHHRDPPAGRLTTLGREVRPLPALREEDFVLPRGSPAASRSASSCVIWCRRSQPHHRHPSLAIR